MSRWQRTATVLGTAVFLAPAIGGLLMVLWRLVSGLTPSSGTEMPDVLGMIAAHVWYGYIFGGLPALATGLILSGVAWRRGTFSAWTAALVSVTVMLV